MEAKEMRKSANAGRGVINYPDVCDMVACEEGTTAVVNYLIALLTEMEKDPSIYTTIGKTKDGCKLLISTKASGAEPLFNSFGSGAEMLDALENLTADLRAV